MNTASRNPEAPATEQLSQRCALFTLLAMTAGIGMGLLAWGPILLQPQAHIYADTRTLAGLANGVNVLSSLPMLLAGAWGWQVLGRSGWPDAVRRPWHGCFGFVALSAGLAAAYHAAPSDLGYLGAHATAAGAFVLLLCGFLAERVDSRFGSARACAAALMLVGVATVTSLLSVRWLGRMDMRPILLLQLLPVLLIPAGALSLPGRRTRRVDWRVMLCLYATARVCDVADASVMQLTTGISGHALMHVGMAAVAAWLAYRASTASAGAAMVDGADLTHATTSLNTSG